MRNLNYQHCLFPLMSKCNIVFTNSFSVPEEYYPQPASAFIPDWYKKLESYSNGKKKPLGDGTTAATAKRCMPVFDAIVGGYIIVSSVDVFVSQKENSEGVKTPYYEWANFGIEFHAPEQLPEHPHKKNNLAIPKFMNPWAIKTPKGYSTLFISPMHRELPWSIFPAIVDTDIYTAPVNFPFLLNDMNFEGLIPAGTPIAQVIPIQRDEWEMSIGTDIDRDEISQVVSRLKSKFFDKYKYMFRQTKEYR